MRHEIPAMLESGGGAIVNMSSIYGVAGKPAHHAYVASKHAVVGMTRSVAQEVASRANAPPTEPRLRGPSRAVTHCR